MHWWRGGRKDCSSPHSGLSPTSSSSSSSSSAPSPVSPSHRRRAKDEKLSQSLQHSKQPARKLTRQRKLRYPTVPEFSLEPPNSDLRSPTNFDVSSSDEDLPLLEVSGFLQTGHRVSPWKSSCHPLPSPGEVGGILHHTSVSDSETNRFEANRRSASTSCVSSSNPSPQSLTSGDTLPSYECFQGHQVGSPQQNQEDSPFHSPTRRDSVLNFKNHNELVTVVHPKLTMESNSVSVKHEVNQPMVVHPLPLPPKAAASGPSSFVQQPGAVPSLTSRTRSWQKKHLIGSGTYGRVYFALNSQTGATCAMKEVTLIPDDPKSSECIKQLEQEINTLTQLKHQNIVQYYGSEIVDDSFYIYIQYFPRGSIIKVIQEWGGALPEQVVRSFTRHILSGLAYLHRENVVHRDIKGANLLVDTDGIVKLADFGVAKPLKGEILPQSMKGSPYWMAPEVLMQKETGYDLAVDIWSLGCTIIEMVTGKPPWGDLNWAAAMFKVTRNETPHIPDNLSLEGKDFLCRCLQVNPTDRATAVELLGHSFVGGSLHQEISSYHETVLLMKKLLTTNQTLTTLPRKQQVKQKKIWESQSNHGGAEHQRNLSAPSLSPCFTLENLPSLSSLRTNKNIYNVGPVNMETALNLACRTDPEHQASCH
ncbi:mitogen-activated protein kinase kinase kinase 5-like isoform X2 [Nymphaea colorata]|uniref:mitogen-activated protein kinase kinase kinase 5-like isoform X2 n=1 Tax=Nymphaea colorata TaxID=210225 RepID=UPI00129D4DAB|nr:mitogen-activated protein kinase kinase kinase 5-like isoform X2 [Nymphaea colorata]